MSEHRVHDEHPHQHGPGCGHSIVTHEDHQDYLHDGHLHYLHDGHVDEHTLAIGVGNPAECTPNHSCVSYDASHIHGTSCGHEAIPHGDHVDYIVDGHLHHPHENHCDDHGMVSILR